MIRKFAPTLAILPLLAACNTNSAPGNDQEAQIDPPAKAAEIVAANAALANVEPAVIKPETMTKADLSAIGESPDCQFRMTEVGYPSFVFAANGDGVIKLNGKLIPVPRISDGRYASGALTVTTRMLDDSGDAGLQGMELILMPPDANDERGYLGYRSCRH